MFLNNEMAQGDHIIEKLGQIMIPCIDGEDTIMIQSGWMAHGFLF